MRFRGRPGFGRPYILASALAALLVVVGSGTVHAETSDAPAAPPEPRIQLPGDVAGFRLPFDPGLDVEIHQAWNNAYSHNGRAAYAYDFGLPLETPVLAAASGVVSYVHAGETACGGAELKYNANVVTIDHPDGSATQYGHVGAVLVELGDVVEVGQQIALGGNSGYTGCRPHLHFARQLQGGPVTQSLPIYFEAFNEGPLLDGQLVQATPTCAADVAAKAGEGAEAPGPPAGRFCATYRAAGTDAPVLFSRLEKAIDHDWEERGPGGYWLDEAPDGFAAAWIGRFEVEEAGVYAFEVSASDRVRLRVDGTLLVDAWTKDASKTDAEIAWRMTAGVHVIEVEHVNTSGDGSLHVSWGPMVIDGAWVRWTKAKSEA